ncbi:beta-lactam-binding protein [Yersinia similis]|uniref:Beta-lactam-binding protein n=1 Tax=Yersinia similis TaxID=367190 RepID=A0ABM5Q0H4_9GAMM|nr:D-alanyl-D-alanine-carboxypeptidase/endopeptidase AmpH [Yersinia similis]AHK20511.1 beta-lactam-binding protein [Yersinia similis]CFQ46537.1 beta-lactam binding protein AmpH [Yersinia similis]
MDKRLLKRLSAPLLAAALWTIPLHSHADTQPLTSQDTKLLTSQVVDQYAEHIFYNSGAVGMALVVIDNNQVVNRSFGETQPGNNIRPRPDSLIRIASITKLMTSEIMVKLADDGIVKLTDPLKKYAPKGANVPSYSAKQPIRLLHLASHTSGLPREQPGGPQKRPVFTWPTKDNRWQWLKLAKVTVPPGVKAAYSNLAYDLLADALSQAAGKPYTRLLRDKITAPLGMKNTTLTPTAEQCKRLMIGVGSSRCGNTVAAAGSGGIYSTPEDMQRWMQQFLAFNNRTPKSSAKREQALYFQRGDLVSLKGMDVAGQADALGLGWVYMAPKADLPGIMQKTGGGGGFITYMAMVPEKNIGVFVVVTRSQLTKFSNMSDGVNQLVADLAKNH